MSAPKQPSENKQQAEEWFGLTSEFSGYVSKPDITNIAPSYLVPGSKNVLLDYGLRVISRPGFELYRQANTGGAGIVGSYDWETSSGPYYSMRTYGTQLEFDWNGSYNTLMSKLVTPYIEFAKVLDYNEQQDVLLMVLGISGMLRWSGGASLVRASTATSVTKQGVLGAQTLSVSATITIAVPGVITINNHGLVLNDQVQFNTTGALPSGLAVLTTYYVSVVVDPNNFQVSTTMGGGSLTTTGTQSGSQGVIKVTNAQTFAFVASSNPGTVAATITDANANFLNAGFAAGDDLTIVGSAGNSRTFTIGSVLAGTITLIMSNTLVTEAAGQNITMYNQNGPTWKSARFFLLNQLLMPNTASISSGAVNLPSHGMVVGDSLQFTSTVTNLNENQDYFVSQIIDSNNFNIASSPGGSNLGSGSGSTVTVIKTTRSILYKGIQYNYSGGENTDTLQNLTAFPSATPGDPTWQAVSTVPLPVAITGPFPNFYPDLIGIQLNMVSLASTKSVMTFGSLSTDYTNFTLVSTRAPGDPYQQPLTSGPATCIVPVDTDAMILNIQSTLIFGSGRDAFDQIDFHMSADNSEELLRIIRYKTAVGMGLLSKDAICPIKNDTIYISREPTLVSLSQAGLESADGTKNMPISDPIKNDFDNYNFTGAHVKYWKRAIFIALPAEGLVLMYDLQRSLWQPPMTIPVSRLAIIDDWLYGHSAVTNETYQLFTGTNDNGAPIEQVARFAYNNGGRRDRIKNFATYWTDGYISANANLGMLLGYNYQGSGATRSYSILGTDQSLVVSRTASPLGRNPFGYAPLGGANPASPTGEDNDPTLLRFQWEQTVDPIDYFEQFTQYTLTTLNAQMAIVAHGSDQWDAGTSAVSRKT